MNLIGLALSNLYLIGFHNPMIMQSFVHNPSHISTRELCPLLIMSLVVASQCSLIAPPPLGCHRGWTWHGPSTDMFYKLVRMKSVSLFSYRTTCSMLRPGVPFQCA